MNERGLNHTRTSSPSLDNFTADHLPGSTFVTVTAMPEPSTLALAGLGVALAALIARRRA